MMYVLFPDTFDYALGQTTYAQIYDIYTKLRHIYAIYDDTTYMDFFWYTKLANPNVFTS